MENPTPEMTPEMYAELAGGQPQPEAVAPVAPQAQPQQMAQPQDDVAQARDLLGISQTEDTMSQLQEQIKTMQTEKLKETMTSKYPDIPFDLVEKEIEKVASSNPQFADAMRTTPDGMDMAYRATQASIQPQEKPDNLTNGEGGGGQGENLDEIVMKGEADDFNLGKFIIGG